VFHLIPHTHWDREWYLPRAVFAARLVTMLDELLAMLERHPELRFTLDGQTVLVEDYLARRPDRRGRISRLVRAGRLAVGPWYVLPDELIPAGASLERNLAFGMSDARALGRVARVLYSPDAFGHPHYLPDLAARLGLRWGVVWRGLAGDRVIGPDLYRWRGPGGRSILVHHLPPGGYEVGAALPALRGRGLGTAWRALRDELAARSVTRHVAVPIGADHHAPHPELPRLRDRLRSIDPNHRFRWSGWEDYFRAGERARPRLRTIEGELRWSYGYAWTLQGVHATRAGLKRLHSATERALVRRAAPLARLAARAGGRARSASIEDAWRTLIQCQFHDTLAGTVSDVAAREQRGRLESVAAVCREIVRDALHQLAGHDPDRAPIRSAMDPPRLVLCNPEARRRRGVVTAELRFFRADLPVGPPDGRAARRGPGAPAGFQLRLPNGRRCPVQVLGAAPGLDRADRRYGYPDLDEVDRVSIGFDPGWLAAGRAVVCRVVSGGPGMLQHPEAVSLRGRRVANPLIGVTVARDGSVTLVDRRTGARYPGLLGLRDERDRGDLYTPWIDPGRRPAAIRVLGVEPIASGPLVGGFAIRWRMKAAGRGGAGGSIRGRTEVVLHAGSPVLRCAVELDNQAVDHRLALRIPLNVRGPVTAGAGQGQISRDRLRVDPARYPSERPVDTAPAQDFIAAGSRRRGLVLQSPGFFEYRDARPDALYLTLLRSAGELSRGGLPTRPGHAAWPVATPEAQERGAHRFELAIAPRWAAGPLRRGSGRLDLEPVLTECLR
jgi:hypothetical protein